MRNYQKVLIAQQKQSAITTDLNTIKFLIAGPGTGKSITIGNVVIELINRGIAPHSIYAVSFTNAASKDLENGVRRSLREAHLDEYAPNVSTIHSLALKCLRSANLLPGYALNPHILDEWESKNFFDSEFAESTDKTPSRAKEVREFYEAFLSTGVQNPPNAKVLDIPVTPQEYGSFVNFLKLRRILFSCILQGELVHEAVQSIRQAGVSPSQLLGLSALVVDEFQDLNPLDVQFIRMFIDEGAKTLLCGDDDQSIYGFRFGSPDLVQQLKIAYPQGSVHLLEDSFRSMEIIVDTSQKLISTNSFPGRIAKGLKSLYKDQQPDVNGLVHAWKFSTGSLENESIAKSCRLLIDSGIPGSEIMILLFNRKVQSPELFQELKNQGVDYEDSKAEQVKDREGGRLIFEVLKILCDPTNNLAKRIVLGLKHGTGARTCLGIAEKIPSLSLSTQDIFDGRYPLKSFLPRGEKALKGYRDLISSLSTFSNDSQLIEIGVPELNAMGQYLGFPVIDDWYELISELPIESTLGEAVEFIGRPRLEQRAEIRRKIFERLNIPPESQPEEIQRVRIMSLHSSKGLSSGVVFIPGLEAEFVPGLHHSNNSGKIYEMARLLYVGITRARSTCIFSFSNTRLVYGSSQSRNISPFAIDLQIPFTPRGGGLNRVEASEIKTRQDLL